MLFIKAKIKWVEHQFRRVYDCLVFDPADDRMQNDEYERLKVQHAALLSLCKGGAKGTVAVDQGRLRAADDERQFCAVCAANKPSIAAVLKLYGLKDWFKERAPQPPAADAESAVAYLEQCDELLRHEAARVPPEQMQERARDALLEFAAHFSGKLIHSSAQGAFLLAPGTTTSHPHVSSRSLLAAGIDLPLDQNGNDNDGFYQRARRLVSRDVDETSHDASHATASVAIQDTDEPDDPVDPTEFGAVAEHIEAIVRGALQGIEEARKRTPDAVDRRLRQVLLPSGNDYLAVSPLPAGGMAALWRARVDAHNAQRAKLAAELAEKTKSIAAATMPDGNAKPARKSKKAKSAVENADAVEQTPKVRPIFERLEMPFGGQNTQNISLFPRDVIQTQMFFDAPQRHQDIRAAWRFVFRPWTPIVSMSDAEDVAKQIASMQESDVFSSSASMAAIRVQSKGSLGALARKCHDQAVRFAQDLGEISFVDDGEDVAIDEDLLRRRRSEPVGTLDLALVNQAFEASYRAAMAQAIVVRLRFLMSRLGAPNELDDMKVRERVLGAIETALREVV